MTALSFPVSTSLIMIISMLLVFIKKSSRVSNFMLLFCYVYLYHLFNYCDETLFLFSIIIIVIIIVVIIIIIIIIIYY